MDKIIVTVDLEYDWETKKTESIRFIPKILDFFDDHEVNATFFVLGELLEQFEDAIREVSKKHEIASHGFHHVNLKKLNAKTVEHEISSTKHILESLGIKCLGFRSPYFLPPKNLGKTLEKFGYIYDSSISKGIIWGRYNNFFVPENPYRASNYDIKKMGDGIVEIPVSNFSFLRMPFGLPFFRLSNKFHLPLSIPNKKSLVFYMHPYEVLNSKPGKEVYFLYRQLYKINNGKKVWKILEEFFSNNFHFISCWKFINDGFGDAK